MPRGRAVDSGLENLGCGRLARLGFDDVRDRGFPGFEDVLGLGLDTRGERREGTGRHAVSQPQVH